jgi:hypothetical protein
MTTTPITPDRREPSILRDAAGRIIANTSGHDPCPCSRLSAFPTKAEAVENQRRIVASWNALRHLPIDQVERMAAGRI